MAKSSISLAITSLLSVFMASATVAQPYPKELEAVAEADTMIMVPMRDGVRLATDVYLPKDQEGPFPVVLSKTPYNFNEIRGSTLDQALKFVEAGYAFVVQNERGRYYSEGEWEILGNPQTDGWDSISWLAQQEWSNGNVGTLGCSSTAEWQMALAAQDHPNHKAMVPMAAGAGIGRVGEFNEQGNWYEGGVHQTLFTTWLYGVQQNIRPTFPAGLSQEELQRLRSLYDLAPQMPSVVWAEKLSELPASSWLDSVGANAGPGLEMLMRKPNDLAWFEGGLYHDSEDFGVPAFWFNSWFDVSQGPNLALFNHARKNASDPEVRHGQFVVVAPTLHCGFFRTPENEDLIVGELNVGDATFPYWDQILGFFDYYLKDADNDFVDRTPKVQYYTMGENQWQQAGQWPPSEVEEVAFYLNSSGGANSLFGDGSLSRNPPLSDNADGFTYDPMNPVPALGGNVCCNGGASLGGSYDQRAIEARADVLVYTSEELSEDTEVTGTIRTKLFISSDALDTDFTIKLVDVYPDGTAYNVDDTIQRARYRDGYDEEVFMTPGETYEIDMTPLSTSYTFKAGHRIRLEVSSSKFPQYMRNLNTGGNNVDETEAVVARNRVHHGPQFSSRIVLPIVPGD